MYHSPFVGGIRGTIIQNHKQENKNMKNFDRYTVKRIWHTLPNDYSCENPFCPAKFSGINKDMADMILVLLEQIDRLKIEKNILVNTLRDYLK